MIDIPDPRTLNAPDLMAFAKALLGKEDRRSHWTVAAITLGRIADERLWERAEYGAAISDEAWAKDTLGMTRGEVRLALKLYRAMERHPEMPWTSLPKPKALLLDEVLRAGGDVTAWGAKARNATSTTAFEREVRAQLGEEEFLTLRLRYPASLAELVEEAFSRAAAVALSPDEQGNDEIVDPGGAEGAAKISWRDPAVGFRALEVLCVNFLQTTEPVPGLSDQETDGYYVTRLGHQRPL